MTIGKTIRLWGIAALIGLSASQGVQAQGYAPVAIVNDQIITGYDVSQRALINSITSGSSAPNNDRALEELISDALRLQAAQRAGIDPSSAEVRAGFDEISRLNKREPSRMRSALRSSGITDEALDAQIKAEVAWRQLVLQRYGSRVRVSENDLKDAVGPASAAQPGETEYLLAEMRFPVAAGGEATARQVLSELTSGAAFSATARTRSSGPSASEGGDLGWVSRSALSPNVARVVSLMNVDRVSEPFVDGEDVVIVGLRATREAGGGTETTYTLAQLVVGVSPGASQTEADAALARAKAVRSEVSSCAEVIARKDQFLPISGDLGALTLTSMPGPVREAVAGLDAGQITEPVRSNDGFHIIAVCNKSSNGPTGDAIRAQAGDRLRAERLDRYSRSLLRELRREAIIERR